MLTHVNRCPYLCVDFKHMLLLALAEISGHTLGLQGVLRPLF